MLLAFTINFPDGGRSLFASSTSSAWFTWLTGAPSNRSLFSSPSAFQVNAPIHEETQAGGSLRLPYPDWKLSMRLRMFSI